MKLKQINDTYTDIEKGLVIQSIKNLDGQEFFNWYVNTIENFKNFIRLFELCFNELIKSFGETGVAGKPIEIKNSVEKIIQLCKVLINWEYELSSLNVPDELVCVKNKLICSTKPLVIDELNLLQNELQKISDEKMTTIKLIFTPKIPDRLHSIATDFENYLLR